MKPTEHQARATVHTWSDRKLRRKLRLALRLWPDDYRTRVMQEEVALRVAEREPPVAHPTDLAVPPVSPG